jgi:hypothetical protein
LVSEPQSLSATHSTQRFFSVSQTLPPQSLEAWQVGATHALFTQDWPLAQSVVATH